MVIGRAARAVHKNNRTPHPRQRIALNRAANYGGDHPHGAKGAVLRFRWAFREAAQTVPIMPDSPIRGVARRARSPVGTRCLSNRRMEAHRGLPNRESRCGVLQAHPQPRAGFGSELKNSTSPDLATARHSPASGQAPYAPALSLPHRPRARRRLRLVSRGIRPVRLQARLAPDRGLSVRNACRVGRMPCLRY